MGSCLVAAKYTMVAEFIPQTRTRNEAGQIIRDWDVNDAYTVDNVTHGILGGGIRVVGSTETWGEDYEDVEWAKMYISDQQIVPGVYVTRRFRITNIRDKRSGRQLWIGDDQLPIEFNVMGVQPIMDPFGTPLEYELLLKGETGD